MKRAEREALPPHAHQTFNEKVGRKNKHERGKGVGGRTDMRGRRGGRKNKHERKKGWEEESQRLTWC